MALDFFPDNNILAFRSSNSSNIKVVEGRGLEQGEGEGRGSRQMGKRRRNGGGRRLEPWRCMGDPGSDEGDGGGIRDGGGILGVDTAAPELYIVGYHHRVLW